MFTLLLLLSASLSLLLLTVLPVPVLLSLLALQDNTIFQDTVQYIFILCGFFIPGMCLWKSTGRVSSLALYVTISLTPREKPIALKISHLSSQHLIITWYQFSEAICSSLQFVWQKVWFYSLYFVLLCSYICNMVYFVLKSSYVYRCRITSTFQ